MGPNSGVEQDIAKFLNKPEAASGWHPVPRDYLKQPYAIFNNGAHRPKDLSGPLTLTTLQANVSPHSQAALAANGTNQLLLWVLDDPARSQVNGAEVVWSQWNGNAWSSPTPVWDDGTADFHPAVQLFGNGTAVAAWENQQTVLAPDATMSNILAGLEISAAAFDPVAGAWTATNLTQNSYLDRSPRLAAANNGQALLTWISNPYNSLFGSSTNQNTVNATLWDGSNWQPLGTVTTNAGMLLGCTVAFDGTNGVFLAVIDSDDNQATPGDEQLWGATYSNGAWSAFSQLTANGVRNANPQAVYDSAGQLLVVWYQGSNIVARAGDLNLNSPAIAARLDGSLGTMAFSLATGPAGQISIFWDTLAPDGTGPYPFLLNYDPTLQVWSQPIQMLSAPNEVQNGFSGAYAANGALLLAYDQTAILVDSNNVSSFGQVDLMLMNYVIGSDLAVSSSNISLSLPNPVPGQNVTISAVVQNLGELGATNVQVGFYAGDPSAGGAQIGSIQTVAGVLSAGSSATVQVNWAVPAVLSNATIYVVVDPNLLQPDRNRANNTATLAVMAPDLAIDSMDVLTGDPTNPVVTAHVINQGAVSAGQSVNVVFYQDTTNGPVLATVPIPDLDAGDTYDASFVWPMAGLTFTSAVVTVYAVVDPTGTVSEFSGANTVASAPVPTLLSLSPPVLTATVTAYNQISLSWSSDSGNVDGLVISRSANGGAYSVIANPDGSVTNLTDSTASCGNSYVYMIVATNSFGNSSPLYVSAATSSFDSEGYGIPDCWRVQYFGHPDAQAADLSRAFDDPDGDHMNNLNEFLTGTNPTNAASVFRMTSIQRQGNDLNVNWQTAGGHTNVLQAATGAPVGFTNVSPNIVLPGSGDMFTNYLDVGAATNGRPRFYRAQLPTTP